MPRVPTVRKADLDRVLKALADRGMQVARIEVRPGGEVVIIPKSPGDPGDLTPLERWRLESGERTALEQARLDRADRALARDKGNRR